MKFSSPAKLVIPLIVAICCFTFTSAANSLLARGGRGAQTDGVARLVSGGSFERTIKAGEKNTYQLRLLAGEYFHLLVEQRTANIAVSLVAPDSKKLIEVDVQKFRQGIERLYWVADAPGDFQIEISSLEKDHEGAYQIRVGEVHPASVTDQLRVQAQKLYWQGLLSAARGDKESRTAAIQSHEQAAKLFRDAGDKWGEASALHKIGRVYSDLRQWQKAFEFLDQALPIYLAANDRQGEASDLSDKGAVFGNESSGLFDVAKATELYDRALLIARTIGDKELESRILFNTAKLYGRPTGDWRKAIDLYQSAVEPGRASGNVKIVHSALNNMGMAHFDSGDPYKALEIFSQALAIVQSIGDRPDEAGYLHNIAMARFSVGDVQKALDILDEAEVIVRQEKLSFIEPYTLHLRGLMLNALGERERAIETYEQGLRLVRGFGIRDGERSFLLNMGETYAKSGEYQKALDSYNQALLIKRPGDTRETDPYIVSLMAESHLSLGDAKKALEVLQQAMPLLSENDKRAKGAALEILGRAYLKLQEPAKALAVFTEASTSPVQLEGFGGTRLLLDQARAQEQLGNLGEARVKTEEALKRIESSRSNLVSPDLRASYFATQQEGFYFYVDLLLALHKQQPAAGFDQIALEASEARRARSLLEFLNSARADIRQGVDIQLVDQEKALVQRINAKQQFRIRLLSRAHTDEQIGSVDKDIAALLTDYQSAQDRIRQASSNYSALTQPQRLTAKEIRGLLDPNTLLLEYSLGPEHSYLWANTPESVSTYELPKRGEIDAAAQRLYALLTARQPSPAETQQQYLARVKEADAQYEREAAALGQMLLEPVANLLGKKRLLIVADGSLGYVPFASLPGPARGPARRPLIAEHEIVYLPSASTLAVLRRQIAGRSSAPKTLAVLADPVFDNRDDRVGKVSTPVAPQPQPLANTIAQRALRDAGVVAEGLPVARLPFSRQEAEAIVALAPRGETLKAMGFNANLDAATSPELSRYRVVHFATHALVNSERPYLSGLLLSLVDEQGKPQDGFLSLNQIYNLNLPADLVFLSACQTAKGKEVKGEGIIGLTRAFMYAGAPRVVASLWKVDDAATAEISKRFYRGILKEGLRPAAALQAAQLEMSRHKLWNSPYYWAGFVLQGEPN